MRVIAVTNQKGGVGKTTTTMNLAHALAQKGYRVLAVDFDPQANLTVGFGALSQPQIGIGNYLLDNEPVENLGQQVRTNLDLVPAGDRLGEFEYMIEGGAKRGFLLQKLVRQQIWDKDFVLIDCAPTSGLLGMNALLAADEVMVPVAGDFYSLQGVSRLMRIFNYVETALQRETKKWFVLTRFDNRRKMARSVRDRIVHYFPDNVLTTPIRETVALAESPAYGKTIFDYRAKNRGAEDYMSLAADVVQGNVVH